MLQTNVIFLLVLLAFALRLPRPMEWLSASVAAFGLALLALAVEAAVHDLTSNPTDSSIASRLFGLCSCFVVFMCLQTIWGDAVSAAGCRLGRTAKSPGRKPEADRT